MRATIAIALVVATLQGAEPPPRIADLVIHRVEGIGGAHVSAIALTADGKTLYAAADPVGFHEELELQSTLYAVSARSLEARQVAILSQVTAIAVGPGDVIATVAGRRLRLLNGDGKDAPQEVKLWAARDDRLMHDLHGLAASPRCGFIFITVDTDLVAVDAKLRSVAKRYDINAMQKLVEAARHATDVVPSLPGVAALAISPDGKRLAAIQNDRVYLFRVAGADLVCEQVGACSDGRLAFSDDSHYLAAGSWIFRADDVLKPVLVLPSGSNWHVSFDRADELLVGGNPGWLFTFGPQGQPLKRYDFNHLLSFISCVAPQGTGHSLWVAGAGLVLIDFPEVK